MSEVYNPVLFSQYTSLVDVIKKNPTNPLDLLYIIKIKHRYEGRNEEYKVRLNGYGTHGLEFILSNQAGHDTPFIMYINLANFDSYIITKNNTGGSRRKTRKRHN